MTQTGRLREREPGRLLGTPLGTDDARDVAWARIAVE